MLSKTKAIFLHTIKYSETSVVAYCFTEQYGRISFLIPGVRKRNARIRMNLLQPLQINEIDFYYKEKHGLMRIKELRSLHLADQIIFDTQKSTVALFLAEILYKTMKEEVKNESLYAFVEEWIRGLDQHSSSFPAFYCRFLLDYAQFLGFYPNIEKWEDSGYFDLKNGIFRTLCPNHEFFITGKELDHMKNLLISDVEEIYSMHIPNQVRDALLNRIMDYYLLHNEGLTGFKSLAVLREVFHS